MKKFIKVITLVLVFVLVITTVVFADNTNGVKKLNSRAELTSYVNANGVNVMIVNKNKKVIGEYHSDGLVIDYEYQDNKIIKSSDNHGGRQEFAYDGDKIINKCYQSGKYVKERILGKSSSESKKLTDKKRMGLAEQKIKNSLIEKDKNSISEISVSRISLLSATTYEDYYVKGFLMNDIAYSAPNHIEKFLIINSNGMTESEIQSFFNSKNSILKNRIELWEMGSNGSLIKTPAMITPSHEIYVAQQNTLVNAKAIIATIQKESSLITGYASGGLSYSDRRFLYAMGYGATDGGDIYACAGFTDQIAGGAELLYELWLGSPTAFPLKMTVNSGLTKSDSSGNTYKGYIWVKNYGTYALYIYTPWTIDTSYLPSTVTGGNYMFTYAFNKYWGTDWD